MESEVKSRLKSKGEKATPMLKLSVIDAGDKTSIGTLCLWRPTEDLFHGLKEKCVVKVFNAFVISIRDGAVNLKSTKQTKFKLIDKKDDYEFCDRKIESIEDILEDDFEPKFKEVDVLGVVIHIDNLSRGFQAIHVCDAMFNVVSVQFWGGIGKFAMDSIIKLGSVLLFSNLQWRKSSSQGNFFQSGEAKNLPTIPCLYVTEFTVVSSDVKDSSRAQMIKDLNNEVKKAKDFLSQAKIRLAQLTTKRPKPMVNSIFFSNFFF